MASCPIKDCNWKGKKSGQPIHLARMHHIRRDYDSESNVLASQSKVCPVPGCGQEVGDLEGHLEETHESWRLSCGKWVFDV
jgi:hypothetical protein